MPRAHPARQLPAQCRIADDPNRAAIARHAIPNEVTAPTGASVVVAPSGPKAVASARSVATVDGPRDAVDAALSAHHDPPRLAGAI